MLGVFDFHHGLDVQSADILTLYDVNQHVFSQPLDV